MRILALVFSLLVVISCARQGSPSGGPKDEIPPRFLGSNPDTLSVNVPTNLKEIKIEFDEYIVLKEPSKNIVVSPPLGSSATFLPAGSPSKTLKIKLNEPLKPNTTYNINFGNAIQDNNEGNKLPYFHYVFSTGDYIDSLQLTGKAGIPSLKKQSESIVVALFKVDSAYNDSLIYKSRPYYVAKLDENGNFNLNYLRKGTYQLIAFEDKVENMQYDLGKEKLGFLDQVIELNEKQDFNLELFDQLPPYKAGKAEQKGYGHIVFKFQGQPDQVEIQPLDLTFTTRKISYEPKSDSLNFWFNPGVDSITEKSKRLKFLVKANGKSDTVSVVYSNDVKHRLRLDRKTKLDYSPTRKVKLTANYPISKLDDTKVQVWKDTLSVPVKMLRDTKNENAFILDFPIELNSKYDVALYPGAVKDIFGKANDSIQFNFKTKNKNDYGNLFLKLENKPEHPFWIQLLNDKDEKLDEKYTTDTNFEYLHLPAGTYYFRILVDENENQHWDTGDFFQRKQPEKSYVYPTSINIRLMWDIEETWVLPKEL